MRVEEALEEAVEHGCWSRRLAFFIIYAHYPFGSEEHVIED
ncbi:hypothetical protein J2736_002729 [Paenibacillus qinlingensis]|uniref:Uncharacterized protein n=1 Tax=Paenibacillus qinlingensis TaxID=1837343 RepID=A0ABU1NVS0_9BACL|nr:hypothetical protein [Paenibacillus qinlingensis]